jgi:N-acetylglucosaminyldiphosphoundecaprenol N-acetyl-beta-D-mannosaminyltransferase
LAIYNNASYTLCDGVPVLWASRFLGTPIEQRITGLDLLPALLEFCATNNFSLFFLGASPGVGDALKAKAEPDIVLVSLTAPKQDIWISENLQYLDTKIAIGIGGAFEVTAGLINRAPLWMQKAGLEWFYRFTQEPKRMFKRYFIEAPVFIPLVILQKLGGGR